jgi:hypothetical protein
LKVSEESMQVFVIIVEKYDFEMHGRIKKPVTMGF